METPNGRDCFLISSLTHPTHPILGWSYRGWSWQWVQVESFPFAARLLLCIGWQILAIESADPSVVAVSFGAKQTRKADSWFQLGSGGPGRNGCTYFSMARKHLLLSVDWNEGKLYLKTFGKWKWKIQNCSIQRLAALSVQLNISPAVCLFSLCLVVWCSATIMV